jgi:succinoglycan biosynthesis transport protein ExoP
MHDPSLSDELATLGTRPYAEFPVAAPRAQDAEPPNAFKLVHRLLRGRYPFVIVLGLLLFSAGAATGYVLGVPKYRAEALIRVQPRLPRILYESEQSTVTPMFSSFVSTQASLVTQDRVIARAMNSDEWRRLARPNTPRAQDDFRDSVKANISPAAPELINVSFVDVDAVAAKTGLEQTLKAYEAIFGQAESRNVTQFQLATLESRRRNLTDEISRRRQDIRTIAAEYGTEDLSQLHDLKRDNLLQIERKLGEIELSLAQTIERPGPGAGPGAKPAEPLADLGPEDIAHVDHTMAGYFAQHRQFDELLETLKARGFGAQHPDVQEINAQVTALEAMIATYAKAWNADRAAGKLAAPSAPGVPVESPEQLRSRRDALRSQADRARTDFVELGNKRLDIEARQREITGFSTSLDEVNRRIDEVNVESKVEQTVGRIEVILPDAVPSAPTADPRIKYAALGGTAGASFVLAVTLLLGLIDRRFRYSDELSETTRRPLLACLPHVTARRDDHALGAAHNIHRIRALLQINSPTHRTVVVTSPSPGEGKTSISISLGMSFAAVGESTLLIDLDLIGRGLTTRLNLQAERGLHAALAARSPEGFVAPVRAPHLWALPIEHADERTPVGLRRESIRTLLAAASKLYSCVIIDTGPILGSLEASYVASAADGVVLVISRGQPRANFERAVVHLREVGARILGVVFNRARSSDFRQSEASTSVRTSRPATPRPGAPAGAKPSVDPLADILSEDLDVDTAPGGPPGFP